MPCPAFPRLATALVFLALAGCGLGDPGPGRVALSVFAASSLTEAFTDLEREFERDHPAIDVQLTFAGSQVLRVQIEQGAAADVFASANEDHVAALVEAGRLAPARTLAHNELVVIVPPANPAGIETFRDLPRASRIVLGTETVPVGAYTRQMLARARDRLGPALARGVEAGVVSEESNVRLVRAKVELGEADAAVVYRTDAAASDRVRMIPIPAEVNVRAAYSIARVIDSAHPNEAAAFIEHVRSAAGRRTLARHGFATEGS